MAAEDKVHRGVAQWMWKHREGYRPYSPRESDLIESAYQRKSGATTIEDGGKLAGRKLSIIFHSDRENSGWQLSSSGKQRDIRRRVVDPFSSEYEYPEIPMATLQLYKEGMVGPEAQRAVDAALNAMSEETLGGRLPKCAIKEGPAYTIYQFYHDNKGWLDAEVPGGCDSTWRVYDGHLCKLIAEQLEAKEDVALFNGGKPTDLNPTAPYRIDPVRHCGGTLRSRGKFVQTDMRTGNKRAVRRRVVDPSSPSYTFIHLVMKHPRVPARTIAELYAKELVESAPLTLRLLDQKLAEMNAAAEVVEIPQEIPDELVCPVTFSLMRHPMMVRGNPALHRIDQGVVTRLAQGRTFFKHPMINKLVCVQDMLRDREMEGKIAAWIASFARVAAGEQPQGPLDVD